MAVVDLIQNRQTIILSPNEHFYRPLDTSLFPITWQRVRMGIKWSVCSDLSTTGFPTVPETISQNSIYDRYYIGFKDATSGETLPYQANVYFLGITNYGAALTDTVVSSLPTTICRITGGSTNQGIGILRGLTHDINGQGMNLDSPPNTTFNTANHASFFGLDLNISNYGLSGQLCTVTRFLTADTNPTMYDANTMDSLMNSYASSSGTDAKTLNFGGAAIRMPLAIYIRFPFRYLRFRIHQIRVWKMA